MRPLLIAAALTTIACASALAQQVDYSKLEIKATDLGGGVYLLNWQGGDSLVLVGDDGVLLVDTSVAPMGTRIKAAIARLSTKPIKLVVNTHAHADHFGANELMAQSGAVIVGHAALRDRMAKGQYLAAFNQTIPPSAPAALPTVTYADAMTIHFDGETIELVHVPGAHTDNDTLVRFTQANVIHASGTIGGDGGYPFFDMSSGGSLAGTIAAEEKMLSLSDAKTRIVADEGAPASSADLKASRDALVTIKTRVQKLIDEGKSEAEAIAAKPTKDFDRRWAPRGGFLSGDVITRMAYQSLKGVAAPPLAQAPACGPSNGLNFICGLQKPEDLVLIPGTRWLIASGMDSGAGLHLIDTGAKRAQPLYGSDTPARPDRNRFANCPGPLDARQAVLHGLSLRPAPSGHYTLYATNHGGRESVEAFDIDGRGATPSATWVGCVLMPDKLAANSVAAFDDGALVSTVVSLPGKTSPDGRNTGAVFLWTPGENMFHRLDGTELPVNNGIETSADGRQFFVVSMGLRQIVAFSRADPSKPIGFAQLTGFVPDNVRMVGTRLVAAGMAVADPPCAAGTPCPRGFAAQAIDPKTLVVTDVARFPATPPYSGTATAIPIDGEIWLSSFNGDRVAYGPIPR